MSYFTQQNRSQHAMIKNGYDSTAASMTNGCPTPQQHQPKLSLIKPNNCAAEDGRTATYPFYQPIRSKIFLPQGKLSDYPLLLDFANLDESLKKFHMM